VRKTAAAKAAFLPFYNTKIKIPTPQRWGVG